MAENEGGLSLGTAVEGYLAWSRAQNKESTYKEKRWLSRTVLRLLPPSRELSGIGARDLEQDYKVRRRGETVRRGPRTGPPCGATINRELTFLQGVFTWAKAAGHVERSPFDSGAVTKFRETPPEVRRLTLAEQERLIAACPAKLRPAVVLSLSTGMRMGEIRRLLWRQVDLDLRVAQLIDTKSKNRAVALGAAAAEMLRVLKRRGEHVFRHEDGAPLSRGYIGHAFARAAARAGLAGLGFHDLRRTFATDFYRRTKDIRRLQRVLGHSSVATTERYLARLGVEEDGREADAIAGALMSEGVRKALGMDAGGLAD